MKRLLSIGLALGITIVARANSITISTPSSLNGYYAYALGVQFNVPIRKQINSMAISVNNVQLSSAPTGYLYVDLLNFNQYGTKSYWDGDTSGDYFASALNAGQGVALGVQQFNWWNQSSSWSSMLSSAELAAPNTYSADGIVNLGLDPDCFFKTYGSCNIQYNTCTQSAPGTGWTCILLGLAFIGLLVVRRLNRF